MIKQDNIQKTFQNTTLRVTVTGTLLLMGTYLLLPLLDPAAANLPLTWVILAGVSTALLPIYPTYRLVSGRLSLNAWSFRFFWFVIFPWALIVGHFSAYVPEYTPIFFLFFVGSSGVGVGVIPQRYYLGNYATLVILYLGSLYLIHPEYYTRLDPALPISLAVLTLSSYWMGRTSNYYLERNRNTARLLRNSRRDKRLIAEERKKSDALLLNILPASVAEELKTKEKSEPVLFENATVLFTDFEGFTQIAETMRPEELVRELDLCFSFFDSVVERYNLEKLKTIGDSYMCAGGVPIPNRSHGVDCVLAALEIQAFMNQMKAVKTEQGLAYWELRLGIHTGPLVAGVIGEKKFAYDVWGDTVNTASRCESSGAAGRINISGAVENLVREFFECEYRGKVAAKHKGEIDMYFVNGIRVELSRDGRGLVPSLAFKKLYEKFDSENIPVGIENIIT